ncbi:MAG: chitinase, partial [Saprospiraceae bacterium]
MKNKLLATIFVAMTFLPLIPLNAQKILGYWPYYRTGSASIQYSNYTDIVYAFLNPTTSGDLNFSDGNFNQLEFNYLVSQCVTNGVSPHISVGGANLSGPIASVAGNTTARGKFVSQIVSFVAGTHAKNSVALAGLDIDWEFPTDWTAKANHLQLIKDLRSALDAQGASDGNTYELAIAVGGSTPGMPAGGVFHTSYFNSDVINYVDFVYIMNYDLGSSGYPSSHHSPYQACVDALSYYTNTLGFPANKLLMGIPFYGRDWSSAYEWKNFATTTTYNSSTGISGSISFNSKPVIDQKVSHICSQGGAGVVVWEISQDASSDALSLSKALYDAFVASGCTPTGGGGSGGGGGGGGSTSGDCVSSTSFNDDYDETFAPTNGDIQLSYWGSSGGV